MPGDERPTARATTEAELRAVTIGEPTVLAGPIELADYDPAWPQLFELEATQIRSILGERVRALEHVGSTAVPGLAAKPIIDTVLAVADSADEAAYVPAMEAGGYVPRIRELDLFEHRLFKGPDRAVNLHVFSEGLPEISRILTFRNWLRAHDDERLLYERAKRELAARDWTYVQNYAAASAPALTSSVAVGTVHART